MKALLGTFIQEKATVWAYSVNVNLQNLAKVRFKLWKERLWSLLLINIYMKIDEMKFLLAVEGHYRLAQLETGPRPGSKMFMFLIKTVYG